MMFRSLPPAGHTISPGSITTLLSGTAVPGPLPPCLVPALDAFFLSSGTAALTFGLLSVQTAGKGDEVILPGYSCPALLSAVTRAQMRPVLCDITTDRFRFNLDDVRARIGKKTCAIVVVHLFGLEEQIVKIRDLAREHDIVVIEDAAQAFGNILSADDSTAQAGPSEETNPSFLGTVGQIGVFSFGRGKPLNLLHGGAALINDPSLRDRAQENFTRLAGPKLIDRALYRAQLLMYTLFFHPRLYWVPESLPLLRLGETYLRNDFPLTRADSRLSAFVRLISERFEGIAEVRRSLAEEYRARLSSAMELFEMFPPEPVCKNALLRFPLVFRDKGRRDRVLAQTTKKKLGVSGMYEHPLVDFLGGEKNSRGGITPIARYIAGRVIALPLHQYVTEKDIDQIVEIIRTS